MKCAKCKQIFSAKDIIKEKNKAEDMQEKQTICPHCGEIKVIKFEND